MRRIDHRGSQEAQWHRNHLTGFASSRSRSSRSCRPQARCWPTGAPRSSRSSIPVTGDAQRGLVRILGAAATAPGSSFAPIMEAPNRGKRSVGLALDNRRRPPASRGTDPAQRRLPHQLSAVRARASWPSTSTTFAASTPTSSTSRAVDSASSGPDRDTGAYDATAFWARGGSADGVMAPDADGAPFMPAGAYGDNIGGMSIAGGVAAALYRRQATGEPSVLDVSLLAVGAWATQFSVNMAMLVGGPTSQGRPQDCGARQPAHRRLPDEPTAGSSSCPCCSRRSIGRSSAG